jgi:5'-nucleotidase
MEILISNDDGIDAPGLRALVDALRERAAVYVVAPHTEQSAVGHAITIHNPVKVAVREYQGAQLGYAVYGTPADCVKLALNSLLPRQPELIVSGINQGANMGTDIIYSGTVSAATEGTLLGIPSIAVSVDCYQPDAHFDTAAAVVVELLDHLREFVVPSGTLLNINVPNVPFSELQGWRLTSQGKTKYVENYLQRRDPRGNAYFWIDGELIEQEEVEHADYRAVKQGYVSVTPIHFDVTDYSYLTRVREDFERRLNTPAQP